MADSPKTKTLTLKTGGARRRTDVRQPIQRSGPRARAASQRQLEQQQPAARARGEAPRPSEKPRRHLRAPGIEPQPLTPYLDETFAVFAPCPSGLEQALSDELNELGFDQVRPGRGGCSFTADWAGVMRANLYSRLSTRILVQVAHGPVKHEDDLLELARRTPWERWFGPEHSLRVDTSAIRSPMRSLQYCTLRTKDGICDRLRELEGARPSIDTVRPDARVHVFLSESTATLYLDSSGESLFKRGWRFDKGEAPLRENLAAGLLKLAGWHGTSSLMDPFCGSGTILIEAAYIALRIPPGLNRPFAFERLRKPSADPDQARFGDLFDRQ